MTELLLRLFIEDRDNISNPKVRRSYGVLAGFVGITSNVFLFAVKLAAGFLTSSVSITADAFNNLSDAASSVVTLAGFKISAKPADPEHPFGHGRSEYIAGFVISALIMVMGAELFKSSLDKILRPEPISFQWISVLILSVSILIKLWMYFFQSKLAKILDSNAMKATAMDSFSDIAATSVVLIGLLISSFSSVDIDGYIGILVAFFILYTGFSTARSTIDDLLGQAPDAGFVEAVRQKVLSYEGIVGIHDMIIHNYGPNRHLISLHAEVPSDIDILKSHDTIDNIERELKEEFNCDAVIHMDPIETNDAFVNELYDKVKAIINIIDSALNIHDFRVVQGVTHTNLIFDIGVPHNFRLKKQELIESVRKAVKIIDSSYEAVITIDENYV